MGPMALVRVLVLSRPCGKLACRCPRRLEIEYFRDKGVWELRKIAEAIQATDRRPISVRWVEVNKGDHENPKIRSRLVAPEIRGPGQEACFAPTPPLDGDDKEATTLWDRTNLCLRASTRANCLAADRLDLLLSAKEVWRFMANPTTCAAN